MFTGSFSRNTHGQAEDASSSPVPGSKSVYVRDIDDVKDAFHGNYESPKLDTRADRGSLRWAIAATVVAIAAGLGLLALLGFASGTRVSRTEAPNGVLQAATCTSTTNGVTYNATVPVTAPLVDQTLADAEGLEIQVVLLDGAGVQVDTKTVWVDFRRPPTNDWIVTVGFDAQVESPRCVANVWLA